MASFICVATITDVFEEYGWYFISRSGRRSEFDRSETSFICTNPKCKKLTKVDVIRYRDDSGGLATFVIFDKELEKLVGRQASDVINEMREVKVYEFTFGAMRKTITVSPPLLKMM